MAMDIFVKFDGPMHGAQPIVGESVDAAMKGYIEVSAITFGAENPITIGSSAGGAGTGKAKFSEVEIQKAVDGASPLLFQALVTGAHYDMVTVAFRQGGAPGGKAGQIGAKVGQPYFTVTFKMVFVREIDVSASDGDDTVRESIKLAVGAITYNYRKQNPDGSLANAVSATWSQVTNSTKV